MILWKIIILNVEQEIKDPAQTFSSSEIKIISDSVRIIYSCYISKLYLTKWHKWYPLPCLPFFTFPLKIACHKTGLNFSSIKHSSSLILHFCKSWYLILAIYAHLAIKDTARIKEILLTKYWTSTIYSFSAPLTKARGGNTTRLLLYL